MAAPAPFRPRTRRRRRARARRRPGGARRLLAFLAILALFAVGIRYAGPEVERRVRFRSDVRRVEGHAEVIRTAARESGQDPNLLAGVMLAESSGEVDAVSEAGALGLFQLMLPTARERARVLRMPEPSREQLLRDPLLNARLAASYLRWLSRRYGGDVEKMLVAYNAGPGRLAQWIRDHGSYDAWREKRLAAGDSAVLAYAGKVARYRERFAARGLVAPPYDHPPVPASLPGEARGEEAAQPSLFDHPQPPHDEPPPPHSR